MIKPYINSHKYKKLQRSTDHMDQVGQGFSIFLASDPRTPGLEAKGSDPCIPDQDIRHVA